MGGALSLRWGLGVPARRGRSLGLPLVVGHRNGHRRPLLGVELASAHATTTSANRCGCCRWIRGQTDQAPEYLGCFRTTHRDIFGFTRRGSDRTLPCTFRLADDTFTACCCRSHFYATLATLQTNTDPVLCHAEAKGIDAACGSDCNQAITT